MASRDERLAAAQNGDQQHAVWQSDVLDQRVGERRRLADFELDEFELLVAQRHQVDELVGRQFVHDHVEHATRGADCVLDTEQVEGRLVVRVVDARHDLGHAELLLGDLGDDDVVLVVACYRHHHIRTPDSGTLQYPDLGAVSVDEVLLAHDLGESLVA